VDCIPPPLQNWQGHSLRAITPPGVVRLTTHVLAEGTMPSPGTTDQAPRTTRKGPQSADGRNRCAQAKTVHGRETRAIRELRSLISYQLRCKEAEMFEEGYLVGPRMRGRKPALSRRLIQSESLNTGERVPWGVFLNLTELR
jgi:hypothetical protein